MFSCDNRIQVPDTRSTMYYSMNMSDGADGGAILNIHIDTYENVKKRNEVRGS